MPKLTAPRLPSARAFHAGLEYELNRLTAYRSLEELRAHYASGGRPPSFRADNRQGVALAKKLQMIGVLCTIYT